MITESIFNGKTVIVPFFEVQNIEKQHKKIYETGSSYPKQIGTDYSIVEGIFVITKHTKWNFEHDMWENPIYISNFEKEADKFIAEWCRYRAEAESLL